MPVIVIAMLSITLTSEGSFLGGGSSLTLFCCLGSVISISCDFFTEESVSDMNKHLMRDGANPGRSENEERERERERER